MKTFLLPFLVDFATAAFSAYSVTHATQNAGATGNVVIAFTVGNAIASDGVIKVTFPAGIDLATAAPAVVAQSSTIDGTIAASVSSQVLTLTRSGGANTGGTAAITITVSNIGNPASASAGGTYTIGAFASDGTTSTGDTAVTDVAAVAFYTVLASTSVTPANLVSNADSSVTIGFTTSVTIPTQGVIKVTFPANFDLATLTPAVSGTPSGVAGTWAPTVSGQVLLLTQASTGAVATTAGAKSFVITNIGNPTTTVGVSSGVFKVVTYQADGSTVLQSNDLVPAVNIYAGALSSATATPASLVTNVDGQVTIAFTTVTTIPTQGVIKVTFPANFDLATLTPAVSGTPSGVAGTWAPTVSGQVLLLTQASTGAVATTAGAKSFVITNIGNPTPTGATGTFTIATYQAGGSIGIDYNAAVPAVTITATLGYSLACVGNTDCTSGRCVSSVCEPALCAVNQYVSAAVCTNCAGTTKSLAGHLISGPDTTCSAACPVNSYGNGSGNCIACALGYTNAAGDNPTGTATTCGECAENYYVASATTCTACTAGTHIAAGPLSATTTTCTNNTCTCTNGTAATAGTAACSTHNAEICASCSSGYALSGSLCKPSCSTAPSAVANTSGTLPATLIGTSITTLTCATGYTGVVTLTCAAGSTTYTAVSTCTANTCTCTNGTAATGTACTTNATNICASCATNYTLQSGLCQPTCTTAPATASRPANTQGTYPSSLTGVDTTTITCATGWYNGGTPITLTCSAVAGTYTVTGTCASCAANYWRSATATCTVCPANQYRIAGATTVTSTEDCYATCPINTYATGALSARTCATCATGTTLPAGSSPLLGPSTSCDACATNYYVSNNVCTACAAGTTRPAGDNRTGVDTACTPTLCTADQYVSSNACVACPTGHTRPAGDDASGANTSCGVCAVNYFVQDGVCTACATNKFRVAGDLISGLDTACTAKCPENAYVSSGNCIACAAGTIKAAGGNPAGSATICDKCAANHYVTTAGVCTVCPAGKHRAAGDSNQGTITTATVCADNTCTCANGTAATGTACTTDAGEICASCATGYALGSDNSCQVKCDTAPSAALPANTVGTKPTTWTEGSAQPITCAAGYQGTITLACAAPGGKYTITGTCDSCAENYAVTSNACVACSATTSRAAGDPISGGNTTCTLCALDHNVVGTTNGVCTPCPAGLGRPAGDNPADGATTCVACRANFYKNNASPPVCTACPAAKPYRIAGDTIAAVEDCGLRCKANQFAVNGTCRACPTDFSLGAGSNPATGGNAPVCIADSTTTTAPTSSTTTTAPGTKCAANQYVLSKVCTVCPEGKTRAAGDDPTGADTACNDPASAHFGGPSFFLAGLLITAF